METGLVWGIVLTYLFIMHLQPFLEIAFEYVKHIVTMDLELKTLGIEQYKMEMMKKYPEMYEEKSDMVIQGFQYEPEEDDLVEFEDDEEDDFYEDNKNVSYKHNI